MIGSLMRMVAVKIAMSRNANAPTSPYVSARFCWCLGRRLASSPSTSALSMDSTPSSTISKATTATSDPSSRWPNTSTADRRSMVTNSSWGGARGNSGPENAVPRFAQTGQDVTLLVELAVDGRAVDRDLRVVLVQRGDALGGGHEAHELHA